MTIRGLGVHAGATLLTAVLGGCAATAIGEPDAERPAQLTLQLGPSSVTLAVGERLLVSGTPELDDGSPVTGLFTLTWSSSAPAVASVDEGLVTAHAVGVAVVGATAVLLADGQSASASFTVTVEENTSPPPGPDDPPTTLVCAEAEEWFGDPQAALTCPAGEVIVEVLFASYGLPSGSCGAYQVDPACHADATAAVEAACLGLASCSVVASNALAGDPCPGAAKLLFVTVACQPADDPPPPPPPPPPGGTSPLVFTTIPFDEPDLVGPGRGGEEWHDQGQAINNPTDDALVQALDSYTRYPVWNAMEPSPGVYDFSSFDALIRPAIDARQGFSFRIMTIVQGEMSYTAAGRSIRYPVWLHEAMQAGPAAERDWASGDTWVPNYNSAEFKGRLRGFLSALGQHIATASYAGVRYRDAVRKVDIGIVGNWGEWHHGGLISSPSDYPPGAEPTTASLIEIIDIHREAFPAIPLQGLMAMFDGYWFGNTWYSPELAYHVLTVSNQAGRIGWRRDNWGDSASGYVDDYLIFNQREWNGIALNTLIMQQWKVAQVGGEPIQGYEAVQNGPYAYWALPDQVRRYHPATIGNGNYAGYTTDLRTRDALRLAFKLCGYRFTLTGGALSETLARGASFSVALDWQNVGLTPVYEDWSITFELQAESSGAVVWTGRSAQALRLWLPRGDLPETEPTRVTDTFALPSDLPAGTYRLVLKVVDPTGYRAPLPLAVRGRLSDGGYLLRGEIAL